MKQTPVVVDPKRPWIHDPADAPADQNWLATFIDPRGETSRLHFTRAWTVLFFARLTVFVSTAVLAMIEGLAGLDADEGFAPPPWIFAVFVLFTALLSYVLHQRRLASARRNTLLALLVLIPVLIGGVGFAVGTGEGSNDYAIAIEVEARRDRGVDDRQSAIDFDRREVYTTLARGVVLDLFERGLDQGLAGEAAKQAAFEAASVDTLVDGVLAREGLQLDQAQRERLDDALAGLVAALGSWRSVFYDFLSETDPKSLRDYQSAVSDRWKRHLPNIDLRHISERDYAAQTASTLALVFWMLPALITMLWSLFWVGRLPNGGGSIRDRVGKLQSTVFDMRL